MQVRGEGANNAVTDAHDFAKRVGPLITSGNQPSWDDLKQALKEYDQDVLPRGKRSVADARRACLDAHVFSLVTKDSPLVTNRTK